ncbi:hypothetical protein KR044_012135, partial [Drosophila immigrans]
MKIVQLNLNHCAAAQDLLRQSVREHKVDLANLSEPFRPGSEGAWAVDRAAKCAIWPCGKASPQLHIYLTVGFLRAKFADVWTYSVYLAPSLSTSDFGLCLDALVADARGRSPVIIAGDFNAWAVDWGSTFTNLRGRMVLETFASLDVVLLNNGVEHTLSRAGVDSIVGLTFVSSSLANSARWCIGDGYTPSDHRAIFITVCHPSLRCSSIQNGWTGYSARKLDPQRFKAAFSNLEISGGTGEMAQKLMAHVKAACDYSMPRARAHNRHHSPVYWWNDEIANARRRCIYARRKVQRSRGSVTFQGWQSTFRESRRALKV